MLRTLLLLIFLLLVSCSFKVLPEERVTLRMLDAKVEKSYGGRPVKLASVELSEMLATERILYKEKSRFGYFAKNRWACPPDCMLERLLLKNFDYLGNHGDAELSLKVLDLYADFSEENPKVVLTVIGELKENSKIKSRSFYLERRSGKSEEELFEAFNGVVGDFLKELDAWIKEVE